MVSLNNQIIVSIKCLAYNHAPYIRQCLDGIVMQKTNFRFEAIVHDDASTDGTQNIIREYAEKYQDIIKPIYETENQYSKHDGSLRKIMNSAIPQSVKYIAICEGDDYWTDSYKLQKQVDFLETHPDYTMVCNRTMLFSQSKGVFVGDNHPINEDGDLNTDSIIINGGLYISTCSLLYRNINLDNYPEYCKKCHVGDYPLQIFLAMKGKVYYFNNAMSVYRIDNTGSWINRLKTEQRLTEHRINGYLSEVNMLKGFADEYPYKKNIFQNRIAFYLKTIYKDIKDYSNEDKKRFMTIFKNEIKQSGLFWRIYFYVLQKNNRLLSSLFCRYYNHTNYKFYL